MDALYGEGCDRCADPRNDAASMTVEFSGEALEKGLQEILGGMDVKHSVQKDIYRETLRQFNKAAAVGLSQAGHPEDLTDAFLEKIRHNNEVFAAFKTHRMQNDIARQMLDAKGRLKSFEQFARDVAPIAGKYTKTWLRTEYDTAVTRAHRAADWQHFEKEKAIYPRLRWMPTTSAAPDPLHTTFWSQGLTLAVDDPFWSHHHPGDRWGCKCSLESTVEPENDAPITNGPAYENAKGLSGNPGKSGKIFSEDHPYYPKNCSSCPFNTGIKNILGTLFNLTKDCEHCKAIAQVTDSLRRAKAPTAEEKKASKALTDAFKETIPAGTFMPIPLQDVKHIDELSLSRTGVKNWRSHPHKYVIVKNEAITKLPELFKRASYYGWAEDDTITVNGSIQPKHPRTKHWLYYKVRIFDDESLICVQVTEDGRKVPYCIDEYNVWKGRKVNKGTPPK